MRRIYVSAFWLTLVNRIIDRFISINPLVFRFLRCNGFDFVCVFFFPFHVGSPCMTTPVKDYILERDRDRDRDNMSSRRRVNKMLSFEYDGHKSSGVVDLSDGETEERSEKEYADVMDTLEERSIGENYEDEDVEPCDVNTSTPSRRKRKRVIASDSENDDDDDEDNIPISLLMNLKPTNQEMSDLVDTPNKGESESRRLSGQRRVSARLNKQRVSEEVSATTERLVGIPTTDNADDDETEEESESESLDGFIVDDDSHESVSKNSDETGEEESDGEPGYAEVMSRLRRDKKPENRKWEYEADMLADFGKDPELCMRAVCVLFRFQTEDEKVGRSSHVSNGRGFSKVDAER